MKIEIDPRYSLRLTVKVILVLSFIFFGFLLINYLYIKWSSRENIKFNLNSKIKLILSDIKYENDKWDLSKYWQDTTTPLDNPLYIITTEGFVIERINPIKGFLDTSRFSYANSFDTPQTIVSPVNNPWRIYSLPIIRNNNTEGIILTAYFEPEEELLYDIDTQLISSADKLNSLIDYLNKGLDVKKIAPRDIHHSIYFSVIDKFNMVLIEDGGPPSYIDRSFIAKLIKDHKPKEIKDELTGEPFLMMTETILNNKNNPIGVIVHGQSLKNMYEILRNQRNFSFISISFVLILTFILLIYTFGRELKLIIQAKTQEVIEESKKPKFLNPSFVWFDKKKSCIFLDDHNVSIEYGSKQYDLCRTLFSSPHKRWEYDEILEKNKIDEEDASGRTFYDAALRINNKLFSILGEKLILYIDKTYLINPNLLKKINKVNLQ